jgi:hypothetical protein
MNLRDGKLHLTDFLGNYYGPGDLVIYGAMSGRSVNIVIGRVIDIWRVWHNSYYVGERYGWERLSDGEPVPHHYRHDGTDLGECDTGLRVKVQPIRAARWKQHRGRKRYIDTRTGKGINPDMGKGLPHVLKESHYVFADGREFDYAGARATWEARQLGRVYRESSFDYQYFRKYYHVNYGKPGEPPKFPLHEDEAAKEQLWWVSRQYQPWVQEKHAVEPVTLEITDNIVKWEGELPGEVPDEVS